MREQGKRYRFAKTFLLSVILGGLALVLASPAFSSSIKVWSTGETLKASDLNSNFAHIHNLMVGGHGARLVDGDINASALISHSKLATPALLPKAWAYVAPSCSSSPCTVAANSRVTSIARTGAGIYTVTLAYTPSNAVFGVLTSAHTASLYCVPGTFATAAPQITLTCYDATGAATDSGFTIQVLDDNT